MSRDNPRATCATCAYARRHPQTDTVGCHAKPPHPGRGWPLVLLTDWCGQHIWARDALLPDGTVPRDD